MFDKHKVRIQHYDIKPFVRLENSYPSIVSLLLMSSYSWISCLHLFNVYLLIDILKYSSKQHGHWQISPQEILNKHKLLFKRMHCRISYVCWIQRIRMSVSKLFGLLEISSVEIEDFLVERQKNISCSLRWRSTNTWLCDWIRSD